MTYLFDLPHGPKVTIKAHVQIWLELHTQTDVSLCVGLAAGHAPPALAVLLRPDPGRRP